MWKHINTNSEDIMMVYGSKATTALFCCLCFISDGEQRAVDNKSSPFSTTEKSNRN